MKYAILVGDGMSDYPMESLGGKTPLDVAKIPNINDIAGHGIVGLVSTVPSGMKPASDIANLSIMGYDPKEYYTGRGPLEAANLGIELAENEIAFRCNLITANNDILADYSAGHISERESANIMKFLNEKLGSDKVRFYHGKSYRNLVIIKAKAQAELADLMKVSCFPPHDISGGSISKHMPAGRGAELLQRLMEDSRGILEKNEINKVRVDLKENPANMIWLWGQGTNPNMPAFKGLFNIEGSVISAVDLINGIGRLVGLEVVSVPGATGYYDTNYQGKGEYAVECLKKKDFVFVHVESPDEAGHNGDLREKIKAIENFDKHVVGTVWKYLKTAGDYRVMVLADHATPVSLKTHTADPAPFAMAGKDIEKGSFDTYNEANAAASGIRFASGAALTGKLMEKHG
ncbi:MAG: cofactor-independent phosphoglycerate mutase [Candidatus Omnitrophica bacterium]|nr:cofactor-independent phosphoglycerate mutase [Candidatus Omnitrophota bacterium]